MKRALAVAAAVAALTQPVLAQTRAAQARGAQRLNEAMERAFKANDVAALAAGYAPDAVMYPPNAMEVRGSTAIRQWFADMMSRYRITDVTTSDTHYESAGDLAVGWGRFVVNAVPKSGGAAERWEGRRTWAARRINGKWLIVSNHTSLPLPSEPGMPRAISAPAR